MKNTDQDELSEKELEQTNAAGTEVGSAGPLRFGLLRGINTGNG